MTPTLERVEVGGLKFYVRTGTSDIKAVREVVERRGYGRYNFTPAAREFWVDLGANIGAFSVWAASQDPSIRIHAYEPDPDMCELIERNLILNGLKPQVEVFQRAVVADRRRTATLHLNSARGNLWRSSIERTWRGGEDITVDCIHIRRVLAEAPEYSYLKMDVEGTEMPLLEWMLGVPGPDPAGKAVTIQKLIGMVFEWSFDVDPSIARFQRVVAALQETYNHVRNTRIPDNAPDNWPPEWFPAARLVWAWNFS